MTESGFQLRFPFKPSHPFYDVKEEVTFDSNELSISLKWSPPQATLLIGPFRSRADAEEFLPQVWGALAWTAITRGTGFSAAMEWSHTAIAEDPVEASRNLSKSLGIPYTGQPVHGLGDGDRPCVIPSDENYRFIISGEGTATVSEPLALFRAPFVQALDSPIARVLYTDERLRTAVQLLCDAHRDSSPRSRFLTEMMALEVLTTPMPKHPVALSLLDTFDQQLVQAQEEWKDHSEEYHSIESLRREVTFRREASLRSRVRRLVWEARSLDSEEQRTGRSRDTVWAYDQRSTLVHEGSLPSEILSRAAEITKRAVLDVLRHRVGLPVLLPAA